MPIVLALNISKRVNICFGYITNNTFFTRALAIVLHSKTKAMKNTIIFLFASLTLTFALHAQTQSAWQSSHWTGISKHYLSFQKGDTPSKSAVIIVSAGSESIRITVEAENPVDRSDCHADMIGMKKMDVLDGSFLFEGKKFKGLNQLDREIRYEEYLLRQKGYFKFVDHWYEPLDLLETTPSREV